MTRATSPVVLDVEFDDETPTPVVPKETMAELLEKLRARVRTKDLPRVTDNREEI